MGRPLRAAGGQRALLALANEQDPVIVRLGGGARDLQVRIVEHSPAGPMLIVHLSAFVAKHPAIFTAELRAPRF